MYLNHSKNMLYGFIGGLGPHASTKFLETIYTIRNSYSLEQELPRIILLSDPCIPNRTEMLLSGNEKVLYDIITSNIEKLIAFGVSGNEKRHKKEHRAGKERNPEEIQTAVTFNYRKSY